MTKRTIVPIGPYHALQEEPEFFKLHVEGETVVGSDIELGYHHRGIEKLSESKDFEETIFLVERICGICSTSHPLACVQAIQTGIIHPTINYQNSDPKCDLDYVPNVARQADVRITLSNSFGLGGQNACLVLGRFDV